MIQMIVSLCFSAFLFFDWLRRKNYKTRPLFLLFSAVLFTLSAMMLNGYLPMSSANLSLMAIFTTIMTFFDIEETLSKDSKDEGKQNDKRK